MDENEIKIKYFVGNTKPTEWTSVYYYSPQSPAEIEEKGEIFAVISLSSPPTFDSEKGGNLLLDRLHELYFDSEKDGVLECLESAIYGVQKRLLELLENDEISSEKGIELNLSVLVKKGRFVYIASMGESKVYGSREGKISDLSSVLKDPDGKRIMKVGSLVVKEGDRFLLLSPEGDFEIKREEREKIIDKFSLRYLKGKKIANESLVGAMLVGLEETETSIDSKKTLQSKISKKEEIPFEDVIEEEKMYEEEVLKGEADEQVFEKESAFSAQIKNIQIKKYFDNIFKSFTDNRYNRNGKTYKVIVIRTIDSITKGLKNIGEFLWYKVLGMKKKGRGSLYIREQNGNINWRPIILLSVIFILVSYFIFVSVKRNRELAEHKFNMEQKLNEIEQDKDQLSNRISSVVNTFDREDEKTELFEQVESSKTELSKVDVFEERRDQLLGQLNELADKINRRVRITDPQIIKDFGVIEGTVPSDIDIYNERLYVSDKGNGIIYSIDLQGGDMQRIADDLQSPSTISASTLNELIFVVQNNERALGKVNLEGNIVTLFPGITQERLGNVTEIDAYEVVPGDNRVYGVREDKKEVIQTKRSTDSYGLPNVRLKEEDFSDLLDIDIYAGKIYVISKGQGVRRFYGDEMETSVRGIINQDNWNNASCIYVDKKYLYVGDNEQDRVMIFNQSRGNDVTIIDFLLQYDLSQILGGSDIIDIVADLESNSLFVLAGPKLFKIDLSEVQNFDY
ncbi:hypothetical protein GF362_04465 [Candidatus Dojkabacteria bacterium]|nr:hypothetical protein [Candidatus Dojkabacteria bacterium]